jgi:DNA-binding CsgD family transcriptional regulator
MNEMKQMELVYSEILNVWREYAQEKENFEQLKTDLELHKRLLNYFQIGDFYYYIFNLSTQEFEYISSGIERVLGYKAEEVTVPFLLSLFHPEDGIHFANNENETMKFLWSLPSDKVHKYKVQGDYRIQKKSGQYIRILHQAVIIASYNNGKPSHALGIHTDISHLKLNGTPVLSFIGLDNEPSYINVQVGKPLIQLKQLLTEREREVLKLLAKGNTYHEIAKILFLSTETVRTHLRNIYRKLNVKSKIEAINVALGSDCF